MLMFLILWTGLAAQQPPAVYAKKPPMRAAQVVIPLIPIEPTYVRIAGHPHRIN